MLFVVCCVAPLLSVTVTVAFTVPAVFTALLVNSCSLYVTPSNSVLYATISLPYLPLAVISNAICDSSLTNILPNFVVTLATASVIDTVLIAGLKVEDVIGTVTFKSIVLEPMSVVPL